MINFPDTIFRIVGYLPLDLRTSGSAIPIFRSLENENSYFTQDVEQGKISGFLPINSEDFARIQEDSYNFIVRIGFDAIYCFVYRTEVLISTKDILIEKLREVIQSGGLGREPKLEAAFIIGDNELVDSLLDKTYFLFSENDRSSSEFFKLNNILRDRIIDQLNNDDLKIIMKNSKLKLEDNRIQVSFPAIANEDQRHELTKLISKRILISRAFGTEEKPSVAFSTSTIGGLSWIQHAPALSDLEER
jgi:hypothetical protein